MLLMGWMIIADFVLQEGRRKDSDWCLLALGDPEEDTEPQCCTHRVPRWAVAVFLAFRPVRH